MMNRAGFRKVALTAHVISSLGWFGAIAAFLVLSVIGLNSHESQSVRAAYLAMEMITWYVIVPLSFASLASGIVSSLSSPWGLIRHYWVVIKLILTVIATGFLLLHTQPIGHLARVSAERTLANPDFRGMRRQLITEAGAAMIVLCVATILAVYKPPGLTPYGRRKQDDQSKTAL